MGTVLSPCGPTREGKINKTVFFFLSYIQKNQLSYKMFGYAFMLFLFCYYELQNTCTQIRLHSRMNNHYEKLWVALLFHLVMQKLGQLQFLCCHTVNRNGYLLYKASVYYITQPVYVNLPPALLSHLGHVQTARERQGVQCVLGLLS